MTYTGYEHLTQPQLYCLFSSGEWPRLYFSERINVCQEVENRYAAENNVPPCRVMHKQMDGASYGCQSGDTIWLNTSLLRDGVFITTFQDSDGIKQTVETPAIAPNWEILDTVFHEGTHGVQNANGTMSETYISPNADQDLYRIQNKEKEELTVGQFRTMDAILMVKNEAGIDDPSITAYLDAIKMDSFQDSLQRAQLHYNDPNIEATLQAVIYDRDNGIFRIEMPSPSYQAINDLCDSYGLHSAIDNSIPHNTEGSSSYSNTKNNQFYEPIDDGLASSLNQRSIALNDNDGIRTVQNDKESYVANNIIDDGLSHHGAASATMDKGEATTDELSCNSKTISKDTQELSID